MSKMILIIGGVRSGKSHFAQELALKSSHPVLFVATAEAGDEEMRQRIEEHKKARPAEWVTLETTTQVGHQILEKAGIANTVILDCITLLVSNIILKYSERDCGEIDAPSFEKEVMAEIDELVRCIEQVKASFIVVTNEVGLGLVPANKMGRLYRDVLGRANQVLASHANEVYLMVAGMPLLIKPVRAL